MKGYWLNQAFNDLRIPANRSAFVADREEYLNRYPLTDAEKQLVRDGDWPGTIEAGASVYTLTKVGATVGVSLLHMGAQMRGVSFEAFQGFLREQNDRAAEYALLPDRTEGTDRG
jgi:protocatechuate 4,5-dioxygenase alpha subunit